MRSINLITNWIKTAFREQIPFGAVKRLILAANLKLNEFEKSILYKRDNHIRSENNQSKKEIDIIKERKNIFGFNRTAPFDIFFVFFEI